MSRWLRNGWFEERVKGIGGYSLNRVMMIKHSIEQVPAMVNVADSSSDDGYVGRMGYCCFSEVSERSKSVVARKLGRIAMSRRKI